MKTCYKTSGDSFSFNPDGQYLECESISNQDTRVGDILLKGKAVFEVLEKHESDEPAENTGLTVYWHKVKRIDPKPWDSYFSDILNDNYTFQGNYRAKVARFTGNVKDMLK